MTAIASSNITSGFIDLATYDEQEKYMYGGPNATAYFVRETRKATWFTQVPVMLSRSSGAPAFDTEWSVNISRAGDYLLYTWLRLTTPEVTLTGAAIAAGLRLHWTSGFMHALIRDSTITFNDLVAARFDNYHLDFWSAFTTPAGKRNGYQNMIGNFDDFRNLQTTIPAFTLNLPLPFFFSRDSGVALPTAALPYNEMRITFSFRNWSDLLIVTDTAAAAGTNPHRAATLADLDGGLTPTLSNVQVWANYAIVSNDERKRMACAPRDILIEQAQGSPIQNWAPAQNANPMYDIRFSHAIKVLFFAVRNNTTPAIWQNYQTASATVIGIAPNFVLQFGPSGAADPIANTSLLYEGTYRLAGMGSDYFSLVNPWYHAPVIPEETGYHEYSYSLDFYCLDPMGSTNYGKLTNISINPVASASAITAATGGGAVGSGADYNQSFLFVLTSVDNNIIRISGGALGSKNRGVQTGRCYNSCMNTVIDKHCKPCLINTIC